ncbi:MAG TPA: ComF family protein [Alcanivoracaceae bacterium]|nr:ComF family protein [Alcanivoracaceae bacterium]
MRLLAPFLFSPVCTVCRLASTTSAPLCDYCSVLFTPLSQQHKCPCGALLWGTEQHCSQCAFSPPYYHQAFCGYRYHYPLNRLINHYKHHRNMTVEACLKHLWLEHIKTLHTLPEALIPIPLHWRRRYWRGFNQAHRLALFAAEHTQLPIANVLRKIRPTAAQQHKNKQERGRSLHGAFQCLITPLPYQHVALIDDVLTTGNTANEAAKTLLRHGVQRVDLWTLAYSF